MNYNPQKPLVKPLTKIIRVMKNIEFATSPARTTTTPENISENIEQMDNEVPTIYS